jgi:type IV pilus assembly protein PilA
MKVTSAEMGLPRNVNPTPREVTFLGSGLPGPRRFPENSRNTPVACAMLGRLGMRERRRERRAGVASRRGFTLVELLIVVAMVGVMAALALVGYRRYVHAAQGGEAKAVIMAIRGGQETYKAEMLQYLNVSTSITTYYPNQTPDDSRYAWVQPTHPDAANWTLLSVQPDGPVRFGYACVAGIGGAMTVPSDFVAKPTMLTLPAGVPWYVIQAKNDHNANSVYAMFASSSVSSEIISENESE